MFNSACVQAENSCPKPVESSSSMREFLRSLAFTGRDPDLFEFKRQVYKPLFFQRWVVAVSNVPRLEDGDYVHPTLDGFNMCKTLDGPRSLRIHGRGAQATRASDSGNHGRVGLAK